MSPSVGGDSGGRSRRRVEAAYRRSESPPTGWAIAVLLPLLATTAAAQDTVYLSGSGGGQTKITGRILDYTGRELRLEHPGGREQSFPAERVLRVETQYGPQQAEADALFAKHRFDRALPLYLKALDAEPRRWVRRQIIAQIVWCYRALDRLEQAGEAFLVLVREDPQTPHFGCIPLAWMPRQPPVDLERAALRWRDREEPAAKLLGASHLLTSSTRRDALERLRKLTAAPDQRIARLAMAQVWRTEVATATAAQIDTWDRLVEQMPEPLAAGPCFILGLTRAQHGQPEQAALSLLRVAILYPKHRPLAARSLMDAGRALEKLDRSGQALRLYRELIRTYPEQTRPVTEAQGRLEAISKNQQPADAL